MLLTLFFSNFCTQALQNDDDGYFLAVKHEDCLLSWEGQSSYFRGPLQHRISTEIAQLVKREGL